MSEAEREEAAAAKTGMAAMVMETMAANDRDGSGGNGNDRDGSGSNDNDGGSDREGGGGNGNDRDGSGGNGNDDGSDREGGGVTTRLVVVCVMNDDSEIDQRKYLKWKR
jgi:hypothetical protein